MVSRRHLTSDTALALLVLAYGATILVVRDVFRTEVWTETTFQTWQTLVWLAMFLLAIAVVLGVIRLASSDRTVGGSVLAIVVVIHAIPWYAMSIGFVATPTRYQIAGWSQQVMYPLLAILAILVLGIRLWTRVDAAGQRASNP